MVTIYTTGLTSNKGKLCPHWIYVFCIYLKINSHLCHLQYKLFCFYNRGREGLQRGTDWVFKSDIYFAVLKRLTTRSWLLIWQRSKQLRKAVISFFFLIICVWRMVCRIWGKKYVEDVQEQGDEENNWSKDGGSNKGLEKSAEWRDSWFAIVIKNYLSNKIRKHEIGRTFGMKWEKRNTFRILVRKPEGMRPCGRFRRRWQTNTTRCSEKRQ